MPLRHIRAAEADYYLILFDADGNERREADASLLSQELNEVVRDGVTDVFISSHGWKGDIPAATRQYDRWAGVVAAQAHDRELARARDRGFKAMAVCVHWPSLPWGVEDVGAALLDGDGDEFAAERRLSTAELVNMYAARIADTDTARNALATILASADDPRTARQLARSELPPDLEAAYQVLFEQTGLGLDGPAAAPGLDNQAFTPASTISTWLPAAESGPAPASDAQQGLLDGGFPGAVRDALLMPVRQLSFWAMKHRAVRVGETGVHRLLSALQRAAPGAHFHLMGHSFGAIVVSAAISGPLAQGIITSRLPRPVNSLFLVQGAMSLWSFAERLPFPPNAAGYFRPVDVAPALVSGPIVATLSTFDRAVGTFFPLGARVGNELLLGNGDLPEYGGVGTFGIQGAGGFDVPVLGVTGDYRFSRGEIYNIDASAVICHGGGPSGAHSDISYPEIAHAFWQAVLCGTAGAEQ
jgi:hypothetical protein